MRSNAALARLAIIAIAVSVSVQVGEAGAATAGQSALLPPLGLLEANPSLTEEVASPPPASASEVAPYSRNPSETRPYALCPPPTERRASCMAAVVPTEGGDPVVGPALEGSGVQGGFSPADLRSAYRLPSAGGKGLTIAVTIAYDNPNAEADLATYRSTYGLPPCTTANGCFAKVNQAGEEDNYPAANAEWGLETSLDLDMISATCPECEILLVEADSPFLDDMGAAVETAAAMGADVISNSWAAEEFEGESDFNFYFSHPGIPTLFATGDWGFGVYYPAASPTAIAVGGTSLRKAGGARGWTETAWSGAGSGCSSYEAKPSWQRDEGCAARTVADVSAVSDTATPVSVYDSFGQPGWLLLGGTSVATPLLAGIEALSSSSFRAAGPSAFTRAGSGGELFDVTDGENGTCGTISDTGFAATYLCQADAGYDGPTGWGTPDGPLSLPVALTEGAEALAVDEAVLHGSIDPGGLPTEYRFEFGETTLYGDSVPVPDGSAGSSSGYVEVNQLVTGIEPGTPYHYRIVAHNDAGTFTGVDRFFGTTPPVATTGGASNVLASTATLHGEVDPEGLPTRFYFEFGPDTSYGRKLPIRSENVGSGTTAVEVSTALSSLEGGRSYHYRLVAVNVAGTDYGADETFSTAPPQWTAGYLPQPPNSGDGQQAFGVSCPEPNACVAVGQHWSLAVHTYATLAEHWDGESWSPMPTPDPAGIDEGWKYSRYALLRGVSCALPDSCMAVGDYRGTDDVVRPLAESWDGESWEMTAPALPADALEAQLTGVSCPSASDCTAVGFYEDGSGNTRPLVERWNGAAWTLVSASAPVGSLASELLTVSCAGPDTCVAGGTQMQSGGEEMTLAEHWDGTEWSVVPTPTPGTNPQARFEGISCLSASTCTAVGYFRSGPSLVGLAESWDGEEWTVQPLTTPQGEGVLTGVSCTAPQTCTAAGYFYNPSELDHGWRPLVERLSGSSWSVLEIASLEVPANWWRESSLNGISCAEAKACVAVGNALSAPEGGLSPYRAFAEHEIDPPPPPTASFTHAPTSPIATQQVVFDASASQPPEGATITSFEWDFGDEAQGNGATPAHTYMRPGDYLVKLVVNASNGSSAEVTELVTVANNPPVASFSMTPADPAPGETLTFDASSSDDVDGEIEDYEWDFGDGATGTGVEAAHAYAEAGDYIATLTVTDDRGDTDMLSAPVHVTPRLVDGGPPTVAVIPPTEPAVPEPADFEIERISARCSGRLLLRLRASTAGQFKALATAVPSTHRKIRAPRPHHRSGRCDSARPAAFLLGTGDSERRKPSRFPYGTGSATALPGVPVKLVVMPGDRAAAALAGPHRLRVALAITFTPRAGAPMTRHQTISVPG